MNVVIQCDCGKNCKYLLVTHVILPDRPGETVIEESCDKEKLVKSIDMVKGCHNVKAVLYEKIKEKK